MIPFQKIFTLLIRTFSKPMVSYLKQRQQQNQMVALRWIFVGVGKRYHVFEHWLNHKILKTTQKKQIAQLKEEVLLEKGIQAIYEVIFYSIVVGIPLYELYTGAVSAQKKQKKLQQNIQNLEKEVKTLNKTLDEALKTAQERNQQRERLEQQKTNKFAQIERVRQQGRRSREKVYHESKLAEYQRKLGQHMKDADIQIGNTNNCSQQVKNEQENKDPQR